MSTPGELNLERLLSDALRPIDPPEDLATRMETTLSSIAEQAAAELSSWADELSEGELEALRDPRNWVRPVVAVGVGGAARGGAGRGRGAPPPPPATGCGRPSSAAVRDLPRPRRASGGLAGLARRPAKRRRPRARASPRIRCRTLSSSLTGHEAEDARCRTPRTPRSRARGRAARRRARPSARRYPAQASSSSPIRMWRTLCQPLTAEDPEHVVRVREHARACRCRSWRCRRSR